MGEIVNGNPVNETHANVKRSRSRFDLHQMVLDTHRFGEIHPHLVFDGVTSDKLPFRSSHSARSYTLKAPLMQDIQMHKDYFMVPLRAILPLQADRIITNPTIGADVPSDAYTNIGGFLTKIDSLISSFTSAIASALEEEEPDIKLCNQFYLMRLILAESIFSNGSLLASLGCNLNSCCIFQSASKDESVDSVFDQIASVLSTEVSSKLAQVVVDGVTYKLCVDYPERYDISSDYLSVRDFLMKIRDTADWYFKSLGGTFVNLAVDYNDWDIILSLNRDIDLDLARLWAYHLSCYEFYQNDKVDYLYSAELFRQYIHSLWASVNQFSLSPSSDYRFNWNGLELTYDYLSSKYFNSLITLFDVDVESDAFVPNYQYFLTLFGYHRSLRYKDYFTGSRTRPLAVGDTSIPVVGGNVSVIDVSRNIQMQRFLNAVNATGRKFGEYLKGIFGVAPSPDRHNPIFLAHTSDSIFAAEVENTGEAQQTEPNSVTAIFRGNSNKYAFEVDVDEPVILLGVTTYDIERAYIHGIERSFFTKDRFDMFLPQLQYVGDQAVYQKELSAHAPNGTFGYQFRDMDRKQLVNRAVGGFAADVLPGYAFVYNDHRMSNDPKISPDFIRSKQSELDQFYLSLTGFSLGTYFHFIVLNNNMCNASRPMSYNPQILG